MAAAVRRLSPVIMTVLIPMARKRSKRSFNPPFTMSLRCTTPIARRFSATASAVPPAREIRSTSAFTEGGSASPIYSAMASAAPLRMLRPSMSTPLILVSALNGTKTAAGISDIARPRSP
jgi:hypothetical protein